jgi:hypothetical protein
MATETLNPSKEKRINRNWIRRYRIVEELSHIDRSKKSIHERPTFYVEPARASLAECL